LPKASLETTDIFRGAFYLCMGGDLENIRVRANGRQIATFFFSGRDLQTHDKAYINGHALVNPVQFREALNHLRDILFEHLRKQGQSSPEGYDETRGRYDNDRKRRKHSHRGHC